MKWAWIPLLLAACNKPGDEKKKVEEPPPATKEEPIKEEPPKEKGPDRIEIQLLLVSFRDARVKQYAKERSKDEAKALALDLLEKAKKGEDFDAFVHDHNDLKEYPGIYQFCNFGIKPMNQERMRPPPKQPEPILDLAFSLKVGETGFIEYDEQKSPAGYVLIKRLK